MPSARVTHHTHALQCDDQFAVRQLRRDSPLRDTGRTSELLSGAQEKRHVYGPGRRALHRHPGRQRYVVAPDVFSGSYAAVELVVCVCAFHTAFGGTAMAGNTSLDMQFLLVLHILRSVLHTC